MLNHRFRNRLGMLVLLISVAILFSLEYLDLFRSDGIQRLVIQDDQVLQVRQQIDFPIVTFEQAIHYAFSVTEMRNALIVRRSDIAKVHQLAPYWTATAKLDAVNGIRIWDVIIRSEEARPYFTCKIKIREDGTIESSSFSCNHEPK